MEPAELSPERRIEADSAPESQDDTDSALGSDSDTTYTESLRSSFLQSIRENGRGYHRYRDGLYIFPDDEREQERLDMQHAIFLRSFGNRLYLAPVQHQVKEVLDLGTGTGIWAIDFADEHPEANVTGVDLSPIQPTWIPPNCKFEVDDYDNEWTYTKKFDLIHGRMLIFCSADFPALFKQAYDALEPGGYLEMHDTILPLGCDDGTQDGTMLGKWINLIAELSLERSGRDPGWTKNYKQWMIDTGFQNVEERNFKWPINAWAKDPELKTIGRWNMINFLDGLEGFCVRLFSSSGMPMEEIELMLVDVRKDIQNRKIHVYWPLSVVYGQKPLS